MSAFEGFLEDIQRTPDSVVARFVAPGFNPEPEDLPVLYLELLEPANPDETFAELRQIQDRDPDCYVSIASLHRATLTTDHGNEVVLAAKSVTARYNNYEARDYERIAKQTYLWGQSQSEALARHMRCLAELQELLRQQHARVFAKAQGHEVGTTARTLYEQQLSFLAKAAAATEA